MPHIFHYFLKYFFTFVLFIFTKYCDCVVPNVTENSTDILNVNFKTLLLQEKLKIKEVGSPTLVLNLNQQDKVGTCTFIYFCKEISNGFLDVILSTVCFVSQCSFLL